MKWRIPERLLILLLIVSPLIFLAVIWQHLPLVVPVHYDIHFTPDRTDTKNTLWFLTGTLSGVSLAIYLLLTNLHRFDPKRRRQLAPLSFERMAIAVVVFITLLNFLLLLSANNTITLSPKWLFALMALLITFLGNYMHNLKPNYFAGIRLPWTLSSDQNWKKTHLLAGKLWFWGGLAALVITLSFPAGYSGLAFFVLLAILVILPIVYSYRLFKQEKSNQ